MTHSKTPRLVFVCLLSLLMLTPITRADSPSSSSPAGPAPEAAPPSNVPVVNAAQPHPAADGDALAATGPVTVSFQAAVEATAAAGVPPSGELHYHIQGEAPADEPGTDSGVGGDGSIPADLSPPVAPPTDATDVALAPGDPVANFQGLSATGWIPPDTVLAVGPSSVVEAVNAGFAVYTKSGGSLQGYTTFTSFFSPVLPAGWQGSLFDPRVLYSAENSRFVLLALGQDSINQTTYFFLAVSQSTDPTGGWWLYRYDASSPSDSDAWADYCGLGADSWGAYVTCNLFYWAGGFKYAKLFTIGPAVYSGGSGAGWVFWNLTWNSTASAFSLQPALPYSIAADAATFFVNTFTSSGNTALLWELTGDRTSSPTLSRSTITVPQYYAIGNNVDQPGSSTDIDGGDTRIQNVAYKSRKVYAVLTTDVNDDASQTGWLLLKLDVDANSLDWQHLLYSGPGFYYFYPAVTLDGLGGSAPNLAVFGSWTDTDTTVTSTTTYASGLFKIYDDQPTSSNGSFVSFARGSPPTSTSSAAATAGATTAAPPSTGAPARRGEPWRRPPPATTGAPTCTAWTSRRWRAARRTATRPTTRQARPPPSPRASARTTTSARPATSTGPSSRWRTTSRGGGSRPRERPATR